MYIFTKKLLDILFGLVGILVMIPLSIIIKLLFICTGDWGRIMYRQRRVGKDGKIIKIFKYRTMVMDADKLLDELLKDESFPRFPGARDPVRRQKPDASP